MEGIRILGVYFSLDIHVKEEMNYKEILSKIKKLLQWWKQRDLTLTGKIQLLKTFAMTKLTYVCSLMAVPNWVFKEVEKLVNLILFGKVKIKLRDESWSEIMNGVDLK